MRDALKIFDRYINKDKILKTTKIQFYTSFLNGSSFYDDFIYLKNELPEYLDSLNIKEDWQDGKYHKYVDGDYCFFTNSQNIILGEVKFFKNKPLFARFNHGGMFGTFDSLLVHNDRLYNGNIPCSELGKYYDLKKREFYSFKMIDIENNEEFGIERYRFSNLVEFNYVIDDKKIIFKIDISKPNDYSLYLQKMVYNKINTSCFTKEIDTNNKSFKKDVKPYLLKMIELYEELIKNDFKQNELNTYFEIFDIFNNHLKNFRYKIKKEEF